MTLQYEPRYSFESADDENPIKFHSKRYINREDCEKDARDYSIKEDIPVRLLKWSRESGMVYGSIG